jgi:hypothetical protein
MLITPIDHLDEVVAVRRGKALTLSIPVEKAQPVFLSEPFYTALVRAVALS